MGLFTRPKDYLDPSIFTEDNIIKNEIANKIKAWIYTVVPKSEIYRMFVIGSIVGYKWDLDSDIDVNVVLSEASLGSAHWHNIVKQKNGATLQGTNHTLNIFVQDFHEPNWDDAIFGVYDLDNNEWVNDPEEPTSLPNPFTDNKIDIIYAKQRMRQLDGIFASMREAYAQGLDVKQYLKAAGQIFLELDTDRKVAYSMGWGTPRYSAENIIFKYMEDQGYLKLIEDIVYNVFKNDRSQIFS